MISISLEVTMKNTHSMRRVAIVAPALAVIALAIAAACSDSLLPGHNESLAKPIATAPPVHSAMARLRARNPNDWVGVAHNDAIDEFRRRFSSGGRVQSSCDFIAQFAREPQRFPVGKRDGHFVADARVINTALQGTPLCAARRRVATHPTGFATATGLAPIQASSEAYLLLGKIEDAVEAASSAEDLAGRLNGVLDASGSLSSEERVVIEATVSVAQHSFEYWQEGFGGLVQEIANLYGPCVSDNGNTYTGDALRDTCMGGGSEAEIRLESPFNRSSLPSYLVIASHPICGYDPGPLLKSIGRSDLRGAFGGGLAGLITGGPAGGVSGALIGGMVASVTTSLGLAWDQLVCIYEH